MRSEWIGGLFLLGVACAPSGNVSAFQDALNKANLSLGESVGVAEADGAQAVRASLVTGNDPVFSVHALAGPAYDNVHVDIVSGAVLSRTAETISADPCGNAVPLADAIATAEAEVNGSAVSSGPDDDGQCNTEVIVLSGSTLWEVKVGPDGTVVEPPEKADNAEGADGAGG